MTRQKPARSGSRRCREWPGDEWGAPGLTLGWGLLSRLAVMGPRSILVFKTVPQGKEPGSLAKGLVLGRSKNMQRSPLRLVAAESKEGAQINK